MASDQMPRELNHKASENLTELMHQGLLSIKQATQNSKTAEDDPNIRFWFPVFFGLYEIVMVSDLEVRQRYANYYSNIKGTQLSV
jgi:hypothetical protein